MTTKTEAADAGSEIPPPDQQPPPAAGMPRPGGSTDSAMLSAELEATLDELNLAYSDMDNLLAASEIATIFLDRSLRIMRFTPAMAPIFNLSRADIGRPFLELSVTMEGSLLATDAEKVLHTLDPIEREVTIEQQGHYLKRVLPYRGSEGNIEGIVVTMVDLTERKRMEDALLLAKEQWERTFDSVPDLIAILDNEHRIVRANRALTERLGLSPEACRGRICYHYLHGTDAPPEFCPHSLTMKDGAEHAAEVHTECLKGDFLVSTSPLLDEQGRLIGSVHVARDIGERKKAEEALRRAHGELEKRVRERTEELAETVKRLQGEIVERERAEASLLGLNRLYVVLSEIDQAIVRASGPETLFHDFCRIAVEHGGFRLAFVGVLEGGGMRVAASCGASGYLDAITITNGEEPEGGGPTGISLREGTYCICNDFQNDPRTRPWHERGKEFGIRSSASIAIKEEGHVVGALTLYAGEKEFFDEQHVNLLRQMGADISFALDNYRRESRRREAEQALARENLERLQAVEALREKERLLIQQSRQAALGEMIGNIAHQWRQPLNTLGLMVQELSLCYEYGDFDKKYLDKTVQGVMQLVHHMSQTIDDFRNFFKPEKEKVDFRARKVIDKAISIIEASLKENGIRLALSASGDPLVHGYPNEYSQVILNILLNARDAFLERGGEGQSFIEVKLAEEQGGSVVTISDNAGGIPEAIIDSIFDPYFTTKSPDKGTGVGLYMAKVIIEKNMSGRLTARNRASGAEFRIEV